MFLFEVFLYVSDNYYLPFLYREKTFIKFIGLNILLVFLYALKINFIR